MYQKEASKLKASFRTNFSSGAVEADLALGPKPRDLASRSKPR
jgi:hypothetical protein